MQNVQALHPACHREKSAGDLRAAADQRHQLGQVREAVREEMRDEFARWLDEGFERPVLAAVS